MRHRSFRHDVPERVRDRRGDLHEHLGRSGTEGTEPDGSLLLTAARDATPSVADHRRPESDDWWAVIGARPGTIR